MLIQEGCVNLPQAENAEALLFRCEWDVDKRDKAFWCLITVPKIGCHRCCLQRASQFDPGAESIKNIGMSIIC